MSARAASALLGAACALASLAARAEPPAAGDLSDKAILGEPRPAFQIEAVRARFAYFDQFGRGYQSRAGPPGGPGDERATIVQPQLEVVARQGDHVTHRIWIPVDVVTAASPDAVDVVSNASRRNEAAAFDWTVTYKDGPTSAFLRTGFHNEENWRSFASGAGVSRAFAEDNTIVSVLATQVIDWFDHYTLKGEHSGHSPRSSTTVSAGVTQLLSPTTVVRLDYGPTLQRGQLSNGWNIVPLTTGGVDLERMPALRARHALQARVSQYLPWSGALKGAYRFYADDWGILAHTLDLELDQRVARVAYLGAIYRVHRQSAVDFFTIRMAPDTRLATADSDLAELVTQTVGLRGVVDVPVRLGGARSVHADLTVERYFRSDDLAINIVSCGLGLLF